MPSGISIPKVLLDTKQQIEQIHRSETEIVEEQLLRLDRLTLRKRERLAHERRTSAMCRAHSRSYASVDTPNLPCDVRTHRRCEKSTTGTTSSASPGRLIGIDARAWSMWSSRMRAAAYRASSPVRRR